MKYKVLYVCYLTRRGVQRQKAYITKATENIRIECLGRLPFEESPKEGMSIPKELHTPLIEVKFFKTKKDALKDAHTYCYPNDIFKGNVV